MRSKKVIINTISAVILEIVSIFCGLILPRIILSHFGSVYNGLIASITQFLSVVVLLKAGISVVSRAALYKPLADKDILKVNRVVITTERFFRKIAYIFLVLLFIFVFAYSYYLKDEFDILFSASLIIILSLGTFAQYFWGMTYQILLEADQKQYIINCFQLGATVISTIIAVMLVLNGFSIHVVKLYSSIIYCIRPLILNYYVHKKYNLIKEVDVDNSLISQRWDAFGQQIAFFVHNNTDIVVLTLFTNLYEVSVYTVYYYVFKSIRRLVVIFASGFRDALGNMFAKNEKTVIEKNLKIYELVVFFATNVIYTTCFLMIIDYVKIYTNGITDVNYIRYSFAYISIIAGAFSCFRIPYNTICDAIGHFKQTRKGAYIEAALNVIISIIAVSKLGLMGVAIGTLAATVFRSVQYAIYISRNIIKRSILIFVNRILIFFSTSFIIYLISTTLMTHSYNNFFNWTIGLVMNLVICIVINILVNFLFYRNEFFDLISKLTYVMKNISYKKNQ